VHLVDLERLPTGAAGDSEKADAEQNRRDTLRSSSTR